MTESILLSWLGVKGWTEAGNLGLPERMDSSILLCFLIISQVYFRDAPNFSEHSHISISLSQ